MLKARKNEAVSLEPVDYSIKAGDLLFYCTLDACVRGSGAKVTEWTWVFLLQKSCAMSWPVLKKSLMVEYCRNISQGFGRRTWQGANH